MKKKLVASLAAAMVLGVAGTSFAASNPFVDVPAKHWSYDAVTKLASAGIVDGYGDGTFKGDKTISRYEMAQIVAKAMAKSDKATAEQKASIDKLSVEFAEELEGLNVRVTKLEKNSSTIRVTGEARLRYEDYSDSIASYKLRTRIHLNGNINDQWQYYGRLQSVNNLKGEGDTEVTMDNAYVKGQIAGTTVTAGRFDYFLGNGMLIDSTLNGVNVAVGNVLKANVFYGKENNKVLGASNYLTVTGLGLNYSASKATTLNGGYYQYEDKDNANSFAVGEDTRKIWEAGFKTQFATNFNLSGSYGDSDASDEDTAYFAQIGYKGANKSKVGSYGAWVQYRNIEGAVAPATTFNGVYTALGKKNGGKGYEVGFNYTPVLNTVLRVKYAKIQPTVDTVSSDKVNFYQAQAEFFF
ncbi:UFO1_4202 family uranium-binding S-layer protein [Pelosinus propionicus]|uniref:S-layer homology domain-containing protein n=1 Tax=Pelosinus propionicus DSM 13327 TaxID=1123291 RepID=A0A1I4J4V4_9FIRM|nr:S-layer homology domain-containing protein [Pelosinus propionicus]SFL61635.1 S-layer homology domain-containing protein [Pelosinus propionicus DSM 13327]